MSQENFIPKIEGTNNPSDGISKSPQELEVMFNLPKIVGIASLSIAALAGGMNEAEARATIIDTSNIPEFQILKSELNKIGVREFSVTQSMGLSLSVDGKNLYINGGNKQSSSEERLASVLRGVTAAQIMNEVKRQNSKEVGISESIEAPHGSVKISVSPYAQQVFKEYGITYINGVISNGKHSIDLTGKNSETPNTECIINGSQRDFAASVVAACKEMRIAGGKPSIYQMNYEIDANDLVVKDIKR